MENLPTAEEFFLKRKFPVSFENRPDEIKLWFGTDPHSKESVEIMIEFAKMHVEAALNVASNLEETNGTEGYKIYPGSILNSYPLTNIK